MKETDQEFWDERFRFAQEHKGSSASAAGVFASESLAARRGQPLITREEPPVTVGDMEDAVRRPAPQPPERPIAFDYPLHQDHARILATHIASNTRAYIDRLGQDERHEWFSTVYKLCKGMIDELSEIANGQRDLVAEALAVRNQPIHIIQPEPTTVRECLRWAWRAAKRGKW